MDVNRHQQFSELLVRNQHRVFRYLVSVVPNRADAEELFQQACLTFWEHWDRYDPALDFVPWACGIAANHVRNFHRKRQNAQVQLDADVLEILLERSAELQRSVADRAAALQDCLDELPARSRAVIDGYYSGRSVAEIAAKQESSANAVYKLLDRVRWLLHECVSARLAAEGAA